MGHKPLARRWRLRAGTFGLLNVAYTAFITSLALTPTPLRIGRVDDWLLHGLAFGVQAALLHAVLRTLLLPTRSLLVSGAAALAYGGLIEILQLGVPGRFFEVGDLVANAVGIAVSTALLAGWELWRGTFREVSG
jgi:VanZ family protein